VKESVPLPTVRITLTGENPLGNAVEIAAPNETSDSNRRDSSPSATARHPLPFARRRAPATREFPCDIKLLRLIDLKIAARHECNSGLIYQLPAHIRLMIPEPASPCDVPTPTAPARPVNSPRKMTDAAIRFDMLRFGVTVAAFVSLMLTLALVADWPLSYFRWDSIGYQIGSATGTVWIADGVMVVTRENSLASPKALQMHFRTDSPNRLFGHVALFDYNAPENRHLPAISWHSFPEYAFIGFPITLLIALTLPLPLLWLKLRGHWQIDRRRRLGQCLHCGYSLTANTTGVCPECGMRVPALKTNQLKS